MEKISGIVLVEPSALIQEGFRGLINGASGFHVVSTFSDLDHYTDHFRIDDSLDILVINPSVCDVRKRSHIREAARVSPSVRLVGIVYGYFDPEVLQQFDEVIHIGDDPSRIVRRLRKVVEAAGDAQPVPENYGLSDREREILVAVAQGMTNKEIAEQLFISIHTVISHRKNITRKTGIKTVSGLTVYALLNGLLDQADIE